MLFIQISRSEGPAEGCRVRLISEAEARAQYLRAMGKQLCDAACTPGVYFAVGLSSAILGIPDCVERNYSEIYSRRYVVELLRENGGAPPTAHYLNGAELVDSMDAAQLFEDAAYALVRTADTVACEGPWLSISVVPIEIRTSATTVVELRTATIKSISPERRIRLAPETQES